MPHRKIKTLAVKLESLITFRIFLLFTRGKKKKKVYYEKLTKEAMNKNRSILFIFGIFY